MLDIDIRAARITWTVFLVVFCLFLLYALRTTLFVMLCAILFAYLLLPLVRLVDRNLPAHVPRTVAIALVFLLVFILVGIGGVLLGSRMAEEAARLGEQLPSLFDPKNLTQRIPLPSFLEPQRERFVEFISEQLHAGTGQALPFAQRLGTGLVHAATNLIYLVLVPILAFLFINEAAHLKQAALSWLPANQRGLWDGISDDINQLLAGYIRALILLALAALVAYGLVLSLMGVPYALLLSGVAALLEIIPVLGPLVAAATIIIVSAFSGFEHLWWLVGFIVAYRVFQDYVLSPRLLGGQLEISALMVLFGLLAGDELGGIIGIFLSVPALATLKILMVRLRNAHEAKKPQGNE